MFVMIVAGLLELENDAMEFLGNVGGLPSDYVRYILAGVMGIPVGLIHTLIRGKVARQSYSLLSGVALAYWVFKGQIIHSLVSTTVAFFLMKHLPTGIAHRAVVVWMMGYVVASHAYRMHVDYLGWKLDFTGPQMLLTIQLWQLAFDLNDGTKPVESLSPSQQKWAINKFPSVLDYYSFVYCHTTFLMGPVIKFREFSAFMDESMFQSRASPHPPMFRGLVQALYKLFFAAIFASITAFHLAKYPVEAMRDADLVNGPLLNLVIYWLLSMYTLRYRYYFGWTLAEIGPSACGLAYNGVKDGRELWDRAQQIDWASIEYNLSINVKVFTSRWNIRASEWLRDYVYLRVVGNKPAGFASTIVTHFTSAIWHGLYPGYYLAYLLASIATHVARRARKVLRPLFMTPTGPMRIYDFFGYVSLNLVWIYAWGAFMLLDVGSAVNVWSAVGWAGHTALLALWIVIEVIAKLGKKKRD